MGAPLEVRLERPRGARRPRQAERGDVPRAIVAAHPRGATIASVCRAMLVAAAGLLRGRSAVTHRSALDELAAAGARVVDARVVDDGDILAAGGVTSGLDLALWILQRGFGVDLYERVAADLERAGRRGGPPSWLLPPDRTCGSGSKAKRCCGTPRGPSEEQLARALLARGARRAAAALTGLNVGELRALFRELADLPARDLSLLVSLPKLVSPELEPRLAAIALIDLDSDSDVLVRASLIQAAFVAAGATRAPAVYSSQPDRPLRPTRRTDDRGPAFQESS